MLGLPRLVDRIRDERERPQALRGQPRGRVPLSLALVALGAGLRVAEFAGHPDREGVRVLAPVAATEHGPGQPRVSDHVREGHGLPQLSCTVTVAVSPELQMVEMAAKRPGCVAVTS